VELWNIGDVVLAMPFLAQLRKLFPGATTTLLAGSHAKELLQGTGLVDEVITADLAWCEKDARAGSFARKGPEFLRVFSQLRARRFDLAFHSRLHVREHAILALSGARRRVGYSFGGRDRALTDALAVDDADRHKVVDWMRLLGPFGGPVEIEPPHLRVSESERGWAAEYFEAHGFSPSDLVIGIHPGASVPEKRWPIENFRDVAAALAARRGTRVLAFVDPGGYGALLETIPGVAAAQVGLRQLIALIQRCNLLVCNDSGPMHIAGALGVPTVAIFGPSVWRWFAPLGEGHQILIAGPEKEAPAHGMASAPYDVAAIGTKQVLTSVERAVGVIAASARTRSIG
jgi:ADP-heptose:LPS heptosyltransferase